MSWLYVPGLADLKLESASLSAISERLDAASVTWRGKPLPLQAWSLRWRRGGFIQLLSGLTCPPSTLANGVATFISSLAETPAKTTAWPESAPEQVEQGSSPQKFAGSQMSAGLILSSEKTFRGMRVSSSKSSCQHWKDWATALRLEYSARPKLAIPCGASDCSSWPSAKVASGSWERDRNGNTYPTLEGAAQDWMAPQVPNGGRSTNHAEKTGNTMVHNGKKVQFGLESQAKDWRSPRTSIRSGQPPDKREAGGHSFTLEDQSEHWPAPTTQNFKGSSEGSRTRSDGKSRADMLHYAAEQFFVPPSFRDPATKTDGAPSSIDGQNSSPPSVKRKLNPFFVEALMRWPTGLSGFERPEMAWIPYVQRMRFYLSALYSQNQNQQKSLF